jgi:hypothetical protein
MILITIMVICCSNQSEFYEITVDSVCQQAATKHCQPLLDAFNKAPPSENEYRYNEYTDCLAKELQTCLCKPDVLKKRTKDCWNSLQDSHEGEHTALGCYDMTLSLDERAACFEDPVHFLCTKDPHSEQCQDVKVLCNIKDFCTQKL